MADQPIWFMFANEHKNSNQKEEKNVNIIKNFKNQILLFSLIITFTNVLDFCWLSGLDKSRILKNVHLSNYRIQMNIVRVETWYVKMESILIWGKKLHTYSMICFWKKVPPTSALSFSDCLTFIYFLRILFIYLPERERESERVHKQGEQQGEGEAAGQGA